MATPSSRALALPRRFRPLFTGGEMKKLLTLATLLPATLASAKDLNPADYPLTAHIRGTHTTRGGGPTSSYNAQTDQYSYGSNYYRVTETEVQIGQLIHQVDRRCKNLQLGADVPARIEKRHLNLLVGGHVCEMRIVGMNEAN
jgi:hypothetical protein